MIQKREAEASLLYHLYIFNDIFLIVHSIFIKSEIVFHRELDLKTKEKS